MYGNVTTTGSIALAATGLAIGSQLLAVVGCNFCCARNLPFGEARLQAPFPSVLLAQKVV